jgi:hypothetical protein
MNSKRNVLYATAVGALLTAAACGGAGSDTRAVEQDTIMETIPREDTVMVEREVEVRTDTVRDTRP